MASSSSSSSPAAASTHSPTAHPSRHPSPSPSRSLQEPTSQLDRLLAYLLAAKRSLSCIHHAHRATTILSRARSSLESSTILAARTAYLQKSLASQLRILRGVQYELENVTHSGQAEFNSMLKDLDNTGKRLDQMVDSLRKTKIEASFRPEKVKNGEEGEDAIPAETKETLQDFVDDGPVEELKDSVKASIDAVQQAKREVDQSLHDLEEDLQAINQALGANTAESSASSSTFQPQSIPAILRALENHAREVAESLESLVKHFDLCVTVIRHTEGGGAAVARNLDVHELPEGVDVGNFEAPTQSMTEEEKREMMAVLDNDAAEVEEVVTEINDRVSQMEAQSDQVQVWTEKEESGSDGAMEAMKLLEQVGSKLPHYVSQSQSFLAFWDEERLKIEERMAGLEDLRYVYQNFLRAYDGLIVEVARRRAVQTQMDKIVREAQSKLRQLYENDMEERDAFRFDQGEYLPMDIWSGLSYPPPKYAFSRVGDVDQSVPELPRKTVEEALKRLRAASPQP